ncbi:unnamed protein product [Bursaphelenchus okinawaensis]|uniref:Nucleotide-diphospho-sugar transferase domain-containing protein n=1 Tax=Bursaphelenchus okinawaensis TaxID=465554 RepID=A0A811L0G3_9BILA|nr:unnamed protein product [Bursaphelenchus okinawaensis]CAG9113955.1 unnamed protein product [Bursaphelenchus okinawaensis]
MVKRIEVKIINVTEDQPMLSNLTQRWHQSEHRWEFVLLKRFTQIFVLCLVAVSLFETFYWKKRTVMLYDEKRDVTDYCDGELMRYYHKSKIKGDYYEQKGLLFSCSLMPYLKKFKLTENDPIREEKPNFPQDTAIVIGTDATYWPSSKAVISQIRKHFGNRTKIIVYDIGNLAENFKAEIDGICNLDYRYFNFKTLPSKVRNLKTFSWKIFILAEVFREYNNIMYMDSSIFIQTDEFEVFFEMMHEKTLTPIQLSGYTGHGLRYATHSNMYNYFPLDKNVNKQAWMMEANMILMQRSEETRKLLKWAVLCAVVEDCINPYNAELYCPPHDDGTREGACHRQDQSLLNVLLYNLEYEMMFNGIRVVPHMRKDHPKNTRQRHETRRLQFTNEDIAQCKNV